jgi:group I intron endonuclease
MKKYHFVYLTTNKLNGMLYVGIHSADRLIDKYLGSGFQLNNDIATYGRECFERKVLQLYVTRAEAARGEQYYVEKYDTLFPNGYNLTKGGQCGVEVSDETKKKMSETRKGKTHSEETKIKMSEARKKVNRVWTEEEKIAQSILIKKLFKTPLMKQKIDLHTEYLRRDDVREIFRINTLNKIHNQI